MPGINADSVWPIALCRLLKGEQGYQWEVERCPICRKKHYHGGGPVSGNPNEYLSHRVKHCLKPRPNKEPEGYILKDAHPERTLKLVRSRASKRGAR
jgi:hypothetical protein